VFSGSGSPLTADLPIFPSLDEHALGEIEAFLGFRQLLLDSLETILESIDPCSDVHGRQLRTRGVETSYLDRRESDDRDDGDEWAKELRIHS
jgi:hypothetical protein